MLCKPCQPFQNAQRQRRLVMDAFTTFNETLMFKLYLHCLFYFKEKAKLLCFVCVLFVVVIVYADGDGKMNSLEFH